MVEILIKMFLAKIRWLRHSIVRNIKQKNKDIRIIEESSNIITN